MQKTRLLGRKVAICSMKNSCNQDLSRADARIRDFDMIWLDDHIEDIVIPRKEEDGRRMIMMTTTTTSSSGVGITTVSSKSVEDRLVELVTQVWRICMYV